MKYDEVYGKTQNVFGSQPERMLIKFLEKIDKSKPVLDIGAGQGRNSIFLARNGFLVDAIDPSKVAIETIDEISKEEQLNINTVQTDFLKFILKHNFYSAVLVFGLLQILNWKSIKKLIDKINLWTTSRSLIFITAFLEGDESFNKYNNEWKEEEKNSFTDGKGNYRTFLKPNEILELFSNYSTIYHWEGLGPKHRHGNEPLQQHHLVQYVAVK